MKHAETLIQDDDWAKLIIQVAPLRLEHGRTDVLFCVVLFYLIFFKFEISLFEVIFRITLYTYTARQKKQAT